MTKEIIDEYFNKNEKQIRSIIKMSKSKFDKDVIFTNVYLNTIDKRNRINDEPHILIFIKRYVYQLYFWYESRSIDLTESLIFEKRSKWCSGVYSLDDLIFINDEDEDDSVDDRLIDHNNIYNIEVIISSLTDDFKKELNKYDNILFTNWLSDYESTRKGLQKKYNQNYKYATIIQEELMQIIERYKKYIKENYVHY